jgi:hypothetical protein
MNKYRRLYLKYKYKDVFSCILFNNYLCNPWEEGFKSMLTVNKNNLLTINFFNYGLIGINKNNNKLFKYKFVAFLIGKYVYLTTKQLRMFSFFLNKIRVLLKSIYYQLYSIQEKDVNHYKTNKFLFIKYYFNYLLLYKWWFKKKYKKQRKKLWYVFHCVSNVFWGLLLKRRIKSFIFLFFNNIKLRKKLYYCTYEQIAKKIFFFIIKKKRKEARLKRKKKIKKKKKFF